MTESVVPHLTCLRGMVANMATLGGDSAALAGQVAIAARLIDNAIVQTADVPRLKTKAYAEMRSLLPAIVQLTDAVDDLASVSERADPEEFEHFLALAAALQRRLFELGEAEAGGLMRSVAAIEGDYRAGIHAAVSARAEAAPKPQRDDTARNARHVDEPKLLAFLLQSFPDEPDLTIRRCSLVSGGFSKFTLGISLAGCKVLPAEIVLRGDASTAFGGASVIDEYRLLRVLHAHGVRVPRPLALECVGDVIDSPFMLVERRPSTVLGHQFGPPQPNRAVCDDIATQIAAVHRVPLDAFDGATNGMDKRSSEKVLQWLDEGYANWRPLGVASPAIETAFAWLRRHVHINDRAPRTLVHGDYVLNNILTHEDKVSAILDWEFAHIGNPAYDLGYSYFMAKALASWKEYLAAYGRAGGVVPAEEQLDYHILLAATRLSVMVCQVTRSFTSGADTGIAGAVVVGDNYYEQMIARVTEALDRVL